MARRTKNNRPQPPLRPEIFRFHDYREFLKVWFEYLRATKRLSLRAIAKKAGVSAAYLPLVLKGVRNLSAKALEKLFPMLQLSAEERTYLDLLRLLDESQEASVREKALETISEIRKYQHQNPKEAEVYRYLTRWFFVAIREMAALPDFQADPQWIHARLDGKVTLGEVRDALQFLTENGYLANPAKDVECMGGIYRMALAKFHQEMLSVASEVFKSDPKLPRRIEGYTMAYPSERLEEVSQIINEAMDKIQALEKNERGAADAVYHVSFSAVPVTVPARGGKKS